MSKMRDSVWRESLRQGAHLFASLLHHAFSTGTAETRVDGQEQAT